jgi:hypothetical protein
MRCDFANEFGTLQFRPLSEPQPIAGIRGATLDAACTFDLETAEKVALITENRRVQVAPFKTPAGWRFYAFLHETVNTGAVAQIESLEYIGGTPSNEIEKARKDFAL